MAFCSPQDFVQFGKGVLEVPWMAHVYTCCWDMEAAYCCMIVVDYTRGSYSHILGLWIELNTLESLALRRIAHRLPPLESHTRMKK